VVIGNSVNVTLGPRAPTCPPGVPELEAPDSAEPELAKPVELDGEPDPDASLPIPVEAVAPEELAPAAPAPDEPLAADWPELPFCAPLPAPDAPAADPEGDPLSHAESKITHTPAKTIIRPFIREMGTQAVPVPKQRHDVVECLGNFFRGGLPEPAGLLFCATTGRYWPGKEEVITSLRSCMSKAPNGEGRAFGFDVEMVEASVDPISGRGRKAAGAHLPTASYRCPPTRLASPCTTGWRLLRVPARAGSAPRALRGRNIVAE
jgi:hypothetical protein